MPLKRVLIVAQVIPQWYVDVLTTALGEDCRIDIITGSEVKGNVIPSPGHQSESLKSRLVCWAKHFKFMKRWMKENRDKQYDMIFAISNPPINSYIGLKLKKQFDAPFVYMNWDLYPHIIETSIKNPVVRFVCKLWHNWNNKNYCKIDRILTIGDVVAESMVSQIKDEIQIYTLPISVDTSRLCPIKKEENIFCRRYNLTDKFVVLYSGKMGMGHNIEVVLETAKLLENKKEIVFVFIGDGPKYSVVEEFITVNNSPNIVLYPMQPEEMFPYSMACGDIGVVTQESSMAHLFMPSKTYSMMACGQAILGICTDCDDLYKMISAGDFGFAVTKPDANEIAKVILKLYKDKELLGNMKNAARKVAVEIYDNGVSRKRYEELFAQL